MVEQPHDNDARAQYLHVLIHANNKGVNLCKSVASAGSLNYPVPTILSWNAEFNNVGLVGGGIEVAKIDDVEDYTNNIFKRFGKRENDVVIIVDGYDTWFQLRPDVMLERFFEINRKSNNRVVRRMGQKTMDAGGIKHRIVFGAQSECTGRKEDPACWVVPESTLANNVYGSGKGGERFLNSGFIMGELGALQKLFKKAKHLIDEDRERATVQDVMTKIFGDQELHREALHRHFRGASLFNRFFRFIRLYGEEPAPAVNEAEFNIGLDYSSLLSSKSQDSSATHAFLIRNDTTALTSITQKAGAKTSSGTYKLPNDIQRSLDPYWVRNPNPILPKDQSWLDSSLYTNLFTGAIPATIHQTSVRIDPEPNPSNPRVAGWGKMWFQPYLRPLLDEHVNEPYRSIATLSSEERGDTEYWPLHMVKWRLRNHEGAKKDKEWIAWEAVCKDDGIEEEVFRDGKGYWKPPRMEY